jgi:hypothetical protein
MRTIITIILVFCCCVAFAACDKEETLVSATQSSDMDQSVSKIHWDDSRVASTVRPLDDSSNPYQFKYKDWDRWLFAHRIEGKPKELPQNDDEWTVLIGAVDANGFAIPLLDLERRVEEATKAGRSHEYFEDGGAGVAFYAEGKMPLDLKKAFHDAVWQMKASYTPQIPSWIAQNPPKKVMLLPDGRVACIASLGTGINQKPEEMMKEHGEAQIPDPIFLFDSKGTQLASDEAGMAALYPLLNPNFDEIADRATQEGWDGKIDRFDLARQGYLAFEDKDNKLMYVYDFFGNRVPNEPPHRDEHFYSWMSATQVVELASWQ